MEKANPTLLDIPHKFFKWVSGIIHGVLVIIWIIEKTNMLTRWKDKKDEKNQTDD